LPPARHGPPVRGGRPGIIYSLAVSHRAAAALQPLLVAATITYFTRLFLRNLIGVQETITADEELAPY
jgi:hypothetical protein